MRTGILQALCLSGLLAWAGCVNTYRHGSPEQLAKTVFKVLQNQDAKGLTYMIATRDDLEAFLATADLPPEELSAYREEMEQIIAEFLTQAQRSMALASDEASRAGVVLARARAGKAQATVRQGADNELAEITLPIRAGEQAFLLRIVDAGHVGSGWVLGANGFRLEPVKSGE